MVLYANKVSIFFIQSKVGDGRGYEKRRPGYRDNGFAGKGNEKSTPGDGTDHRQGRIPGPFIP